MKRAILSVAMALLGLLSVSVSAQDVFKGDWMGRFANDKFFLTLKFSTPRENSVFSWSSDIELDKVKGLRLPQSNAEVSPIHFELVRDAGTIIFDGMIKNGSAIGDYQFTPSQDYIAALKSMGYDNLVSEQLLRLA